MNGGKFLLIRQSYGSTKIWTLPGGGFDPKKESAKSASVREVFEELGIKLNEDSLVELPKLYTEAEYKRDTVCIYFADISGINIQLRTNLEISEVKFCTKEEMKELNLSRIVKFAMEGLSK
jgi:8-oxo-dGTP pyrophosphatase MutT (NUDIX family)